MELYQVKAGDTLYSIAKKYNCWNSFIENYKLGNVYFESVKIKNICKDVIKNLIVRVWGFSAYFNELPEEYKDLLK